jgi:hypothetical protein
MNWSAHEQVISLTMNWQGCHWEKGISDFQKAVKASDMEK